MLHQLANFANDFLASGHTGAIRDRESDFDPITGELRGVSFEMPLDYRPVNEPVDCSFIGGDSALADTTTMTDDHHDLESLWIHDEDEGKMVLVEDEHEASQHGRWAHLADAHLAEREAHRGLYASLDVTNRPWGENWALSQFRYQRFVRLSKFAEECDSVSTLRTMAKQLWKRYKASVRACLKTKVVTVDHLTGDNVEKIDWSNLYLKSDQVNCLMDYIKDRQREIIESHSAARKTERKNALHEAANWLAANAGNL